jgi:DsbC/DsbD-like thiol-disulfide interchange protein
MNRSIAWFSSSVSSIALVANFALAGTASAQGENTVTWQARSASSTVAAGATVLVTLTATIQDGWHLYSMTQGPGGPTPTRIALAPDGAFTLANAINGPVPASMLDPNFGITVETYDGQAAFVVPVRPADSTHAGPNTLTIKARYQACSATLCLPPRTATIALPLAVGASHPVTKARTTA